MRSACLHGGVSCLHGGVSRSVFSLRLYNTILILNERYILTISRFSGKIKTAPVTLFYDCCTANGDKNASAATPQLLFASGGNAAFGSGTAALAALLSASGASTYEASATSFAGTLATTGLPSGSLFAPQFSALGGQNVSLYFEEV